MTQPPVAFSPVDLTLRDGRSVTVRAVEPGDRDGIQAALRNLSAESRYSRFMSALRELSPQMLDRATQPNPERELQLVAVAGASGQGEIVAGARYSGAAGSTDCEFAIAVTDAWHGQGLARQLLETLMRAARERGFERMEGYILASNSRMLGLARRLGFVQVASPEGPTVCMVRCDLGRTV